MPFQSKSPGCCVIYKEELNIPVSSIPVTSSSLLPPSALNTLLPSTAILLLALPQSSNLPVDLHIPTLSQDEPMLDSSVGPPIAAPLSQPVLSTADWSMLINKMQAGNMPFITISPQGMSHQVNAASVSPPTKVFTQETAIFSQVPDPGALWDPLIQMALNKIFIALSMLMTASLNKIKHNDVKFKPMTHGPGTGKSFLNEASFCAEDNLNNFKFGQAYTNWLTLIKTVSAPW